MTIQRRPFTDWQKISPQPQYQHDSPNLMLILNWLISENGGQNLGCWGPMPANATYIRSHYNGAAVDYRYANPGKGILNGIGVIRPKLVNWSDELGITAIHDYYNCEIWRSRRTPNEADAYTLWWKKQTPDGKMGATWATYFHIETSKEQWDVTVPIDMRLGKLPQQQALKPTLKLGSTGDYVRWLQQRLFNNGHTDLIVDGKFGQTTVDHVRWFQAVNGLQPDGVVGPKTWAAVDALPAQSG